MNLRKNVAMMMLLTLLNSNFVKTEKPTENKAPSNQGSPALNLGQECIIFNTIGKYPTINILSPLKRELKTILCGKKNPLIDKKAGLYKNDNPQDLEHLIQLQTMVLMFGIYKQKKLFHEGYREAFAGKLLEKILVTPRPSSSDFFFEIYADACAKDSAMWFILKDNEEFKYLIKNLSKHIKQNNFVPNYKPLLVLQFREDPYLVNLDINSQNFLNNYFTLVDSRNEQIRKFFNNIEKKIYDVNNDKKRPKYIDETFSETIFRYLEEKNEKFKVRDNAEKIFFAAVTFAGVILTDIIFNKSKICKNIKEQFVNAKEFFFGKSELTEDQILEEQERSARRDELGQKIYSQMTAAEKLEFQILNQ